MPEEICRGTGFTCSVEILNAQSSKFNNSLYIPSYLTSVRKRKCLDANVTFVKKHCNTPSTRSTLASKQKLQIITNSDMIHQWALRLLLQ